MSLPQFHGWKALGPGDITNSRDVFVRVLGDRDDSRIPLETNRLWGSALNRSPSIWVGSPWWVYRKTDAKSIPRRIVMHESFSNPLPLP